MLNRLLELQLRIIGKAAKLHLRLLLSWELTLWAMLILMPLDTVVLGSQERVLNSTTTTTVSLSMTRSSSLTESPITIWYNNG